MRYKERNRKQIKLPSGATIVIAKLNTFSEPFIAQRKTDDDLTAGVRLAKYCLTNPANGPFCFEQESARIVDKPTADPGEITIEELEQDDADAIIREITVFSGLDKAGREARNTFPAGQAPGDQPASNGDDLPRPADGTLKTAAG